MASRPSFKGQNAPDLGNRDITPAILVIPGELPAFIDGCLRIEGGLLHPVVGQPSL
jgi:hypothetical protein